MELSLFPLHVVLFPGMALLLHIFEERYKRMIRCYLEGDATFGVVLIREGSKVGKPATPHLVGTCAQVIDVERLPDGRINLLTVGQERFRINHFWEEDGCLRGDVTFFEDEASPPPPPRWANKPVDGGTGAVSHQPLLGRGRLLARRRDVLRRRSLPPPPERLSELAQQARRLLVPYLTSIIAASDVGLNDVSAQDPARLSFWAASLLIEPAAIRQSLFAHL